MTPEVTDFIPGSLEDTHKFIEVADGHHAFLCRRRDGGVYRPPVATMGVHDFSGPVRPSADFPTTRVPTKVIPTKALPTT